MTQTQNQSNPQTNLQNRKPTNPKKSTPHTRKPPNNTHNLKTHLRHLFRRSNTPTTEDSQAFPEPLKASSQHIKTHKRHQTTE